MLNHDATNKQKKKKPLMRLESVSGFRGEIDDDDDVMFTWKDHVMEGRKEGKKSNEFQIETGLDCMGRDGTGRLFFLFSVQFTPMGLV